MTLNRITLLFGFVAVGALTLLLPTPRADAYAISVAPSWSHWLGTTPAGYDLAYLTVYSSLRSTLDAVVSAALTFVLAGAIGFVAAEFPRSGLDRLQSLVGRLIDSVSSFVVLATALVALPHAQMWLIYGIAAAASWPGPANIVRSSLLRSYRLPYVEAARALAMPRWRIFVFHVLPELWPSLAPLFLATAAGFIGLFGAVGYLGLGGMRQHNLGYLLFDAQSTLTSSPYFLVVTVAFLLILVSLQVVTRVAGSGRDT